ncbi:MAG TPA: GNAT family N-acetyltransferase [Candidatus Paceibacterota bacterium]
MTVLITKRLMLSHPDSPDDVAAIVGWLNDPEVVRYSEQRHLKHNKEFQGIHIRMFDEPPNLYRAIYKDGRIIGTITARVDRYNDVADVGLMIGEKSEWGKGFGTEAWTSFCDHLLNNGVRKIEGGTMSINRGMVSIFRKYDMIYEGRRHAHFLYGGETVDMVLWGKFCG